MASVKSEDTHFYIDYAPPDEAHKALRCINSQQPMTTKEVFDLLELQGQPVKSRRTEILRRLYDLGLATQLKRGNQVAYLLSSMGKALQHVESFAPDAYPDLMHFLHFSSWSKDPGCRKYLWSYRRCSELAWKEARLLPRKQIAAVLQAQMLEEFPDLDYTAQSGGRFDSSAAGRWAQWIMALTMPPFTDTNDNLTRRAIDRHELALLALDDVYRSRGYRYGDPVILDETLLDEVARVFFLDHACCRQLIDIAARLTRDIKLSDTLAGTSVSLLAPYGIERI